MPQALRPAGILLAAVSAGLFATNGLAALAPEYERIRELGAIIGSPELSQKLSGRVIEGIEAQAGNTYRVWTADCSLAVTLVDAPADPRIAGPWQFAIRVGDLRCK